MGYVFLGFKKRAPIFAAIHSWNLHIVGKRPLRFWREKLPFDVGGVSQKPLSEERSFTDFVP